MLSVIPNNQTTLEHLRTLPDYNDPIDQEELRKKRHREMQGEETKNFDFDYINKVSPLKKYTSTKKEN